MKTATIGNVLLSSSILFFSACSTTSPKIKSTSKKTLTPSLSAYNIIGIDRSQPTETPIFIVSKKPKKVFNLIKVIPHIMPMEIIEPEPEINYITHTAEPIYEEPIFYAQNIPIVSETISDTSNNIEVISYAPTREKSQNIYSQNIEVISYGAPSSGRYFSNQPTHSYGSDTAIIKNEIESKAKSFLGTKYVWGATGPSKFDCSGFTQWVYRDSGITIPRVSKDQAKVGNYVQYANLRRGDMVFFDTKKRREGKVTHVGIYLGNNNFIHASSAAKKVVIYNFEDKPFYKERFLWGRRVINNNSYLASN